MGIQLFDDADDNDVSAFPPEEEPIKINKEYAKRFEHNKKREDLQRYEEMKKKGLVPDDDDDDDDSESDTEDSGEYESDTDKMFSALLKLKNKDPGILNDKEKRLFDSDSDSDDSDDVEEREERDEKRKGKGKGKYRVVEEGEEIGEESEEDERKKGKSYVEEQEDLRREVLEEIARAEREAGEGEELLRVKSGGGKRGKEREDEGEDLGKKLDEYFGRDEDLDEDGKFLKHFWLDKKWKEEEGGEEDGDGMRVDISEDEEALERQEDYEREFNFRFEEGKTDRVLGHARVVEGSVRKETNTRKQQRERKKERMAKAEEERREEVKRLKNLKKKEIQEKFDRFRKVSGVEGVNLTEDDLEGDFDPLEYDKKMKELFGDEYYEDADPGFVADDDNDEGGLEKPDFGMEDELLGLPKDWDVINSSDGFLAERERLLKSGKIGKKNVGENGNVSGGDEDNDDESDAEVVEGKRKRKRKLSLKEKVALDKEMEDYYKLDYEGSIGDLKTRFKYTGVAPRKFGLSPVDILLADEKELNDYVPLKKMAPYREEEYVASRKKRYDILLARRGALLQGALLNGKKGKKRKDRDGDRPETSATAENRKAQEQQPVQEDESKLSRSAKRRRRQKEQKLPQSRLVAYGKLPASSKKKKSDK